MLTTHSPISSCPIFECAQGRNLAIWSRNDPSDCLSFDLSQQFCPQSWRVGQHKHSLRCRQGSYKIACKPKDLAAASTPAGLCGSGQSTKLIPRNLGKHEIHGPLCSPNGHLQAEHDNSDEEDSGLDPATSKFIWPPRKIYSYSLRMAHIQKSCRDQSHFAM
jgi:hypothetical protein